MFIRTATIDDLAQVTAVETACFLPAEAATEAEFKERLHFYGDHFWLLFGDMTEAKLIGFVDGMVTDLEDLTDEMYEKAAMHQENGQWQMIFGLNTLPEYRCQGYAGILVEQVIAAAKEQGRQGVVLTCKEQLVHYYAKFGFVDEGISASTHGNVVWHQMRIKF